MHPKFNCEFNFTVFAHLCLLCPQLYHADLILFIYLFIYLFMVVFVIANKVHDHAINLGINYLLWEDWKNKGTDGDIVNT